jgi:hypothetical protein
MTDEKYRQYQESVKPMADADLVRWTGQWTPGTPPHIAGQFELQSRRDAQQRRREDAIAFRAWLAIGISTTALIVSVLSALLRK